MTRGVSRTWASSQYRNLSLLKSGLPRRIGIDWANSAAKSCPAIGPDDDGTGGLAVTASIHTDSSRLLKRKSGLSKGRSTVNPLWRPKAKMYSSHSRASKDVV